MKIVQIKQMPEIHIKIQSQYGFTGPKVFCRAAELALDGFFAALCKTSPSDPAGMADFRHFRLFCAYRGLVCGVANPLRR